MELLRRTPEFWPLASPPNLVQKAQVAKLMQTEMQSRDIEIPLANAVAAILAIRAKEDLNKLLGPFSAPFDPQTFALYAYIEHLDELIIAEHHANFPDCSCTASVKSPSPQSQEALFAEIADHNYAKLQGSNFTLDDSGVGVLEYSLIAHLRVAALKNAALAELLETGRILRAEDLEDPLVAQLLPPEIQGRYAAFLHFQTTYDLAQFAD